MKNTITSLVLACISSVVGCRAGETLTKEAEISGVVRHKNELLLVLDNRPGTFLSVAISNQPGGVIDLSKLVAYSSAWPHAPMVCDLESIEVLADGRIVGLSEQTRALIGPDGVVAYYDHQLSELGNRGLEGPPSVHSPRSSLAASSTGGTLRSPRGERTETDVGSARCHRSRGACRSPRTPHGRWTVAGSE